MRHAEELTEDTRVAPVRRFRIDFLRFSLLAFVALLLTIGTASVPALAGDVFVHGHTQRDGTYVPPHWRSAPDGGDNDDWTKGGLAPVSWTPQIARKCGRSVSWPNGSGGRSRESSRRRQCGLSGKAASPCRPWRGNSI